jgi:nucleoside-diphosphate-sugar epimerase
MFVFVTGGTGFIGQVLTKALLSRGWTVLVLVRQLNSPQARHLLKLGAQCTLGDITDRESMRAGMTGVDLVIHNAGYYQYGLDNVGKQRMYAINVLGTANVLSLTHELGIRRVLYVSSTQAFGDTQGQERCESFVRQVPCRTSYELSKTQAHEIAIQYQQRGLPLIVVCPNAVTGANDHSAWGYFLRLYINRVMPPLGWSPHTIHGNVYVDDLAEGIALAAEKGQVGQTYLLSGEGLSFRHHLAYWHQYPGAFKPFIWLPGSWAARLFRLLEPVQRWLNLPAFISYETAVGASTNWHYSSDKAKAELGWQPRSAEAMWKATFEGELALLPQRKGQSLVKRLKPLDILDATTSPPL